MFKKIFGLNKKETFVMAKDFEELIVDRVLTFKREDIVRLDKLMRYYKGSHDSILAKERKVNKPCNKLIASHPSKITDTATAYFLGQPIVLLDDEISVQEKLNDILKENAFDDLMLEIAKECSIRGKSGLLVYQDEDAETKLIKIPADEFVEIKGRTIRENIVARIYDFSVKSSNGVNEIKTAVEVYDKRNIMRYILENGELVPDIRYKNYIEPHIFGECPFIVFKNNEEEIGDFEKVESLIDAYDKLISLTSDEHDAYRNAYLMVRNLDIDEDDENALAEGGTIAVGQDGDAKFITKTIQHEAVTAHLNKLQEDIHNFTDIPNMSDEKFSGNVSGISLKFKLLGLENKCIIKESKFKKSLIQFCKCINPVIKLNVGQEIKIGKLKIQFTRNIPQNISEIADIITKLEDIVDKETLLSLLPFVENPQLILEKLEEDSINKAKEIIGVEDDEVDEE